MVSDILSLVRGNLDKNIRELFLFDAFYALTDQIISWLKQDQNNRLRSIYTEHLAGEHQNFIANLKKENLTYSEQFIPTAQISLSPTDVCHNCVIENAFQIWLEGSCLRDK